MKFYKIIILIFLQTYNCCVYSNNRTIDSLKNFIKITNNDTSKAKALSTLGICEWQSGNFNASLKYVNNAIEILLKLPQNIREITSIKKLLGNLYNGAGLLCTSQTKYSESLKFHMLSLSIREKMGNNKEISESLNNIGVVHWNQGNYSVAAKYYFDAIKKYELTNDTNELMGTYMNLGIIYEEQQNYSEAIKYYNISLSMAQKANKKELIVSNNINLGVLNSNRKEYEKALNNYDIALKILKETNNKSDLALCYNNLGTIYKELGINHLMEKNKRDTSLSQINKALDLFFTSLKMREELGEAEGVVQCNNNIGQVNTYLKKYTVAKEYLNRALRVAEKLGNKLTLKVSYGFSYELAEAQGNHKEALDDYKKYIIYKDSLINEENTKKIMQTQMNYEFEKRESQTKAEQDKKDTLAEEERQKQIIVRNSFICGFAFVLLLAILILRGFRNKQKANVIIMKQKEEVEKAKYIIENQKQEVEEKQKEILDSIHYAKRIQTALITSEKYFQKYL